MRESAIVRKIINAVKKKYPNAYVRKLSDRFTRGLPDILIVAHCASYVHGLNCREEWGGTLFVETKARGGKTSKIQDAELSSIRANGAEAVISRDAETVLAKLEEMGAV